MARSYARTSATSSPCIDDVDAITPCPPSAKLSNMDTSVFSDGIRELRQSRSPSPSSINASMSNVQGGSFERRRNSVKTLEEGTEGDPERLWKRMLALQQIYGCYRSARMSAALELRDTSTLLPSKACLDLMNEDISMIPDDVEEVLKRTTFARRL
ncbi:uncharacterized protein JN550_010231 [Neoarthrinium moseri]|uniref:uncharacterized protein n=1 Tax=Neoarthrinium moseri TaxID=1658444 RepID=UPI001FDD95C4|nr:uncharacterized protein JN550_010231 [Neoarthrinium moseri]KAI1862369.1 hypothetical protein JN550_010231 [Neoarthrinium moseri]